MKNIRGVDFYSGSREENLPDFSTDFPYIASCVEFDEGEKRIVPWHWHKTVELFFIEQGTLEYNTPYGSYVFSQGSGGLVNSDVLHMTRPQSGKTVQLLHIFDTSFIGGEVGSRIEQKYIMPMTTANQLDMIVLCPENPTHQKILNMIRKAFSISELEFGYEIKLRGALVEIWLELLKISDLGEKNRSIDTKANERIKLMMIYVHENFSEKISVSDLAKAGYMSERDCFRTFRECLHMTPLEYIINYRLQKACHMLIKSKDAISVIGHECGLGSSSYFGKIFREHIGITPMEYRRNGRIMIHNGSK